MGLGNPGQILQRRQRKDKEMRFGTWNIKSWNRRDWGKEGKKLKRDEEACCRSRKMEGVCRGPPNAVRHNGEEEEEDYVQKS
jgi:hypothetical protein